MTESKEQKQQEGVLCVVELDVTALIRFGAPQLTLYLGLMKTPMWLFGRPKLAHLHSHATDWRSKALRAAKRLEQFRMQATVHGQRVVLITTPTLEQGVFRVRVKRLRPFSSFRSQSHPPPPKSRAIPPCLTVARFNLCATIRDEMNACVRHGNSSLCQESPADVKYDIYTYAVVPVFRRRLRALLHVTTEKFELGIYEFRKRQRGGGSPYTVRLKILPAIDGFLYFPSSRKTKRMRELFHIGSDPRRPGVFYLDVYRRSPAPSLPRI